MRYIFATFAALLMLSLAAPAVAGSHNSDSKSNQNTAQQGGSYKTDSDGRYLTREVDKGKRGKGDYSTPRIYEKTKIPDKFTGRYDSSGGGPKSKGVGDKTGNTAQMNDKAKW